MMAHPQASMSALEVIPNTIPQANLSFASHKERYPNQTLANKKPNALFFNNQSPPNL